MKVFKFLCVRPILLILVLGFSTSCGTDNTNEKIDVTAEVANEMVNGEAGEET